MEAEKRQFQHGEAFRLMTYRCEACGYTERIWNSRDGVTPFCITCRDCKALSATHINWKQDQLLPDYIPASNERVFIDMPESLKAVFARRRVMQARGTKYAVEPAREAEIIQGIIDSFQTGSPFLVVIP